MDGPVPSTHDAIRDLIARYTWLGDRGDSAGLSAIFTEAGVLDVGPHGGAWHGRARIRAELDGVAERVAVAGGSPGPVRHHVSSLLIDVVSPTVADAASYFAVYTSIGLDHWGRYRDRLTLESDGMWRFERRTVRLDGSAPGSLMAAD